MKKRETKTRGKKFRALFLMFSLMILSANLYAERKGAEIVIQKNDGKQVRGELIVVKKTSLLLKESDSGADASVDIGDTKVIKIVKKSAAGWGALSGLLVGGGLGYGLGRKASSAQYDNWFPAISSISATLAITLSIGLYGLVGAGIGALIGSEIKGKEVIQIEGKSDHEIREALEKLRSKARIKNYQ